MIKFDEYTNKNKIEHNPDYPYISDHSYRILYLYAKDPYEDKYQFFIKKRESIGLKHFNDPKAFIEYSNNMNDVYKKIDHYNLDKENKILIVFDDMIADMINNKKLNSIVTELFIRRRKLNISLCIYYAIIL